MNWSAYLPSVIALLGIPIATLLAYWREQKSAEQEQRHWISQRWWERKADAYSNLIDILWRYIDTDQVELDAMYEGRELSHAQKSEEEKKQEQKDWKRQRDELRKAADIGAFIISERSSTALREYWREIGRISTSLDEYDPYEVYEKGIEAARSCLTIITEEAVRDLQLKPT